MPTGPASPSTRFALSTLLPLMGVASLVLQSAAIVYSRVSDDRYFCWAPNDETAEYSIETSIGERKLTPEAVRIRYQRPWFEEILPEDGLDLVEFRSHRHAIDVIRQYESTYGRAEGARVTMTYRINKGALQTWRWPE